MRRQGYSKRMSNAIHPAESSSESSLEPSLLRGTVLSTEDAREIARFFQVLADPTRVRLVKALAEAHESAPGKNPMAVALGRKGGLRGGRARMDSLSPEERKKLAMKAARARWGRAPVPRPVPWTREPLSEDPTGSSESRRT